MKIYNETKTQVLTDFDLSKGYLVDDKILVATHPSTEAVAKVSHIEVIAEYPNGGKDTIEVIDIPEQAAMKAWEEYEDIQVYKLFTAKELAEREIERLKNMLQSTDYKAIKYAEGQMTESEYAKTKTDRQNWRNKINELEVQV